MNPVLQRIHDFASHDPKKNGGRRHIIDKVENLWPMPSGKWRFVLREGDYVVEMLDLPTRREEALRMLAEVQEFLLDEQRSKARGIKPQGSDRWE